MYFRQELFPLLWRGLGGRLFAITLFIAKDSLYN